MSTTSADPSLLEAVQELLRTTLGDRSTLAEDELADLREMLEQRYSDGEGGVPLLEALARVSILSSDLDRAKTMLELLADADRGNALAEVVLPQLNTSIGLPETHTTFADDARTNGDANDRELHERKPELTSTPRTLEVASTNVCNINPPCVQCWKHVDPAHGYIHRDAFHMPKELIRRLSPWIGRATQVSLHGIGEPLAHPQLFDSVRHAGPDTEVVFVSNALLLTETRIEKILDNGIGTIDFSLDAATAETFARIRNNDFDAALDGIRRLRDARDARGLEKPRICLNMCLMRENVHEAARFVELAHDLRAASVHLFHMNKGADYSVDWFDYESQHCEHDPEAHDAAIDEAFERAEELGVDLHMSGQRSFLADEEPTSFYNDIVDTERFFCRKPWTSLLIQNSGDVYNCCWQDRPIDNLHNRSIWEIWNGSTLRSIRESTAAGKPHPNCVNSKGNLCPYLGRV